LIIILGLAATVVVAAGIHQVPDYRGADLPGCRAHRHRESDSRLDNPEGNSPLAGQPDRHSRHLRILIGLILGLVLGVAQLATLLPQYSAEIQQDITNFETRCRTRRTRILAPRVPVIRRARRRSVG
jgi:hypothetical protein